LCNGRCATLGTPLHLASFNVTGVAAYAKSLGEKGFKTCGSEGNPKPKVRGVVVWS